MLLLALLLAALAPGLGQLCIGVPSADLSVHMSAPTVILDGASPVQLQVDVINAGPNDAQFATMLLELPSPLQVGLINATYTAGPIFCARPTLTTVNCTIPLLTAGTIARVLVPLSSGRDTVPTTVVITAVGNSSTCDPSPDNQQQNFTVTITKSADVRISIAGPSFAIAGQADLLNETVVVTNNGPSDGENVVSTLLVPSPLLFISVTPVSPGGSCSFNALTELVTCQWGTIAAGDTRTFLVSSQVPSNAAVAANGANVTFVANVSSTTPNLNEQSGSVTKVVEIRINCNLGMTKSGDSIIVAGTSSQQNPYFYTLLVDNSGPSDAYGVHVSDALPSPTVLYSAQAQCVQKRNSNGALLDPRGSPCVTPTCTVNTPIPNLVLCNIGYLAVTQRVSIIVAYGVGPEVLPQVINNTASVTSVTLDLAPDNNQYSHQTVIQTLADVYTWKGAPQTSIVAGDGQTYFYTLVVGNFGPSYARNVSIDDNVPPPMVLSGSAIFVNGTGSCTRTNNFFSCALGDLVVNQTVTLQYAFTVPASTTFTGVVTNCANSSSSSTTDPNPANNIHCNTTTVLSAPQLAVSKVGPNVVNLDAVLAVNNVYLINVTNTGSSVATNVVLTDLWTDVSPSPFVPIQVEVDTPASCVLFLNYTINCALGTLAPGATVPVLVFFTLNPAVSVANGTVVTNHVHIASTPPDSSSSINDAYWPTIVLRSADVSVNKTGPLQVCAGGSGLFTVTVTNHGPGVAQGVGLVDVLPSPFVAGDGNAIQIVGNTSFASCAFQQQQTLNCSLGGLPPGASVTVTFPFSVPQTAAPGLVVNTANVTTTSLDQFLGNNAGSWGVTICNSAPLALTKAVSSPIVVAGDQHAYQYTLTGSNPVGPSAAFNVVLRDVIPPQWTYVLGSVQATGGGNCTVLLPPFGAGGGSLECTWASLSAGAAVTVTFQFTVDQAVQGPQTVQNCGFLSSNTTPNPVQACVNTTVQASADLSLRKFGPAAACAGDPSPSYYSVRVTNNGPSVATQVVVTDVLPAAVRASPAPILVSGNQSFVSCGYQGNTLNCTLGSLSLGATVTVAFPFTVPSSTTEESVQNTAFVTSPQDANTANNFWTITTPICNSIDLAVNKTGNNTVVAGQPGTYAYTLRVWNQGITDAINVVLTDPIPLPFIPVGQPLVSGAGQCVLTLQGAQTTLSCAWPRIVPIAQIEQVVLFFSVPVGTDPGGYINCATVGTTSGQVDSNPGNNRACFPSTVTGEADLSVQKQGPAQLCAGSVGLFFVTITNNGPALALNVNLTDTLPPELVLVPGSAVITGAQTPASCSGAGALLVCQLGQMAVNSTIQVRYQASVPNGVAANAAGVVNTVVVNATSTDSASMNNHATWTTIICAHADLGVVKSAPPLAIAGAQNCTGAPCIYTLQVTNYGPADVSTVTLQDPVPAGIVDGPFVSTGRADFCSFGGGNTLTCIWSSAPFLHNTSDTVSFLFTVPADATASVVNCATVSSATDDPNPGNDVGCNSTIVQTSADLSLTKQGPAQLCAGGPGSTFTLTIFNNGPSVARHVTVRDTLPAGLVPAIGPIVPASCSYAGSTFQCLDLGDLPPQQSVVITFPFGVVADISAQSINVTNYATVAAATVDQNTGNNIGQATVVLQTCATLGVTKTGPVAPVVAGDSNPSHFQISVFNSGVSPVFGVTVTDSDLTASDATILGVSSALGASCGVAANVITCTYTQLAAGATDVLTISFTSPATAAAGSRNNCALLSHAGATLISCAPWTIVQQSALRTHKTGAALVYAGLNFANQQVFTVTVTNFGLSVAPNATLTDPVPGVFAVVQVRTDTGSCLPVVNNVVSCNFGALQPGQQATVWYTYNTAPDAPVGDVVNTACAQATGVTGSCAEWTTSVKCIAQFVTTLSVNASSIVAGSSTVGTFTLWTQNLGPSTSLDTLVEDNWPPGLVPVGVPIPSQGSCLVQSDSDFSCDLGRLDPGQSAWVNVSFRVDATATLPSATNTACVDSGCGGQVCGCATVNITTGTDLVIVKDDCVEQIALGGSYAYTVTVTNAGPSDATNVVVRDAFPSELQLVAINAPGAQSCQLNGGGFTCVYAALAAHASTTITVEYRVPANALAGYVTNCASVSSATPELNGNDNLACDTDLVVTEADLQIQKTIDSPDCIVAGSVQTRTYTVTVTNLSPGTTSHNVVVLDQFPAHLILVSALPAGCTRVAQNISCSCGDLEGGEQCILTFSFVAASSQPPGIVINVANVTADTPDPNLCNNNVTLASPICAQSDLWVQKSDGVVDVIAGDGIVYVYQYRGCNNGPSDAPTIQFADVWPTVWSVYNLSAPGAVCVPDAAGFTCTLPNGLAAHACYAFNASFTVPPCATACDACNTITISSSTSPDPDSTNNVAIDCDQVHSKADVAVCKTDGVTQVVAGAQTVYTYTVTVVNNGPSCAQRVQLLDYFPWQVNRTGAVVVEGQGTCIDVGSAGDFSCNLGTLLPDQVVLLFVNFTVPASARQCSVTNRALVSSETYDPVACNNEALDVDTLLEEALLLITKTDDIETIAWGDTSAHAYTITYRNLGPSVARDVVLTDEWPGNFVQFKEGITASNGTACTTTGGDFTCHSGDLAPSQNVTVTVRYTLRPNAACGAVTNEASVFSPTDQGGCREAVDVTTVSCPPVETCLTCLERAPNTTQCQAKAQSCLAAPNCSLCFYSILANPVNVSNICFQDPQSCEYLSCAYGTVCGLGQPGGGPCNSSPSDQPILCPPAAPTRQEAQGMVHRKQRSSDASTGAVRARQAPRVPAGQLLRPKTIALHAALADGQLHISLDNALKGVVEVQALELQVALPVSGMEVVDAAQPSRVVQRTTCALHAITLEPKWSYSCTVHLSKEAIAGATLLKVVVRGVMDVTGGYHIIVGSAKVSLTQ